jgi:hypothetical protein
MTELERQLEALIDQHGARHVLEAFAGIAYDKAEHLARNWQDKRSASNWMKLGHRLCKLVDWSRDIIRA